MKKALAVLILSTLLLTSVTGCQNTPEEAPSTLPPSRTQESTEVPTRPPHTQESTEVTGKDPNEALFTLMGIPEIYRSVLRNQARGFDAREEQFTYLNDPMLARIAIADVDEDGKMEILVSDHTGNIRILREYNGIVYCYSFSFRGMYHVTPDGYYAWNTNAGNTYGTSKIQFNGGLFACKELYRVENAGTENPQFYIENEAVTEEALQAYAAQIPRDEINWQPFEAYPTVKDQEQNGGK